VPHPTVKHVDTEVFIAAFIPDEKDRLDKNDVRCRSFLTRVLNNEPTTRLRLSFTALGEFLFVYLTRRSRLAVTLDPFQQYISQMRDRFEPYSPELKGPPEKLHYALRMAGSCCEVGKSSHADAMISAYAMVDPEAVGLYTRDRHMISCPVLNDNIREFRRENQMPRLRIRMV
jgi:hypothetical protein